MDMELASGYARARPTGIMRSAAIELPSLSTYILNTYVIVWHFVQNNL